jgi:hypothetical protein
VSWQAGNTGVQFQHLWPESENLAMSDIPQRAAPDKMVTAVEEEKKPTVTLAGTVQKILKEFGEPEKAEIAIEGADALYQEIRIDNTLKNADGEKVRLKEGAEVDVTVEAPPGAFEKKSP